MKVKYVGPYKSVSLSPRGGQVVAHGETVEVPDELGAGLLEQPDNWVKSKASVRRADDAAGEVDVEAVPVDDDDVDEIT